MRAPGARRSGGDRPLDLLVDARGIRQSGIGRYLREVVDGALADRRFGRVVLLGRPDELRAYLSGRDAAGRAEVVAFPHHFYSLGAQLRWCALLARGALRADVAFFPHYDVPLPPLPAPAVVVVQDLAHFRMAPLFPRWKVAAASLVMRRAVERAAHVLVSSAATRRDLLERHPGAAPRLSTVPLGVDPSFGSDPLDPGAAARADALRPYLLCVGNRKPHKNLPLAVEALARLRPRHPGLRLVVAGPRFGEDDGVAARARALGVGDAVVELGAVPEALLRALYAGAECLLFPSLHEGFGLPVLEAMTFGTPVVASDRASIPEVAGDAALLLAPDDAGAWAAAVDDLLRDPVRRAELAERGRSRAARFPWARTAARTLDVLWSVGAGRPVGGAAPVRAAEPAGVA